MTYREILMYHKEILDYTTVTIIRNPIYRTISLYYNHGGDKKWKGLINFLHKLKNNLNEPVEKRYFHWLSQYDYLINNENKIKIDHILRFEDLPPNFSCIHPELNVNNYMISKNRKERIDKIIDDECLKLIYEIYQKDFETFNYKLEY